MQNYEEGNIYKYNWISKWYGYGLINFFFIQGAKAGEDGANYIISVKSKYFIIMSMHSIYKRNFRKLQQEFENFNR